MFGYVVANTEKLDNEQLSRYRALYCGLCRRIGERHGASSRLTLSYDLVFLILVLSSVFDGEDLEHSQSACAAHLLKKREYIYDTFTDYAADMNVALAYYNCMDDWQDDASVKARLQAQLLGKEAQRTCRLYPRQMETMRACLHALNEAERRDESNPDVPANLFGEILGELFRYEESETGDLLFDFGCALGRFIYLMDAYADLKNDIKKKKYNPLIRYTRSEIIPMLNAQMAQCVDLFSLLPMKCDKDLCENILYSGVWTKSEILMQQEARKRHE